jgi:2,5-diketo-D-gluconate reductase A
MDDAETERVVAEALAAGYRLIDTAEKYGNENGVGAGVRASGVPREDVFVTTKFDKQWHGTDLVADALRHSLDRLGFDYVDLFLIHWPNPAQDRYVDAWRGMRPLAEEGLVRAIGTSNFKPAHLQRLFDETGMFPELNQIQLNPLVTRPAERAFHAEHAIVTQSWSPLGGRKTDLLALPVIEGLAREYGRTPAQIVLRWHLQLGHSVVAKSTRAERLRDNVAAFSFAIDDSDVALLSTLDDGTAALLDSDVFGH